MFNRIRSLDHVEDIGNLNRWVLLCEAGPGKMTGKDRQKLLVALPGHVVSEHLSKLLSAEAFNYGHLVHTGIFIDAGAAVGKGDNRGFVIAYMAHIGRK